MKYQQFFLSGTEFSNMYDDFLTRPRSYCRWVTKKNGIIISCYGIPSLISWIHVFCLYRFKYVKLSHWYYTKHNVVSYQMSQLTFTGKLRVCLNSVNKNIKRHYVD